MVGRGQKAIYQNYVRKLLLSRATDRAFVRKMLQDLVKLVRLGLHGPSEQSEEEAVEFVRSQVKALGLAASELAPKVWRALFEKES
mmetsp:Transcript_11083/g.18564  ORF Transcript_11083/g.18564 Transcript_11083/m.18564 type:complete len:86 (-) Transcript_11083:51-308(-)